MPSEPSPYSCQGITLENTSETFGYFCDSSDIAGDGEALRDRMDEEGYLYIPGFLNREKVLKVRDLILQTLAEEGSLHPEFPVEDGVLAPGENLRFRPELVRDLPEIKDVLYRGEMMQFMERFFAEEVLHFDYTWFRSMSRGNGTPPHCDIVYMGRGTKRLFSAWVPYVSISLEVGGLMILEHSHRHAERLKTYLEMDVDSYCLNKEFGESNDPKGWRFSGALTQNARTLRKRLGGRWLTTEYEPGDLLLFSMATIHASLDNKTDRVRLSSDSRYQRVSDPVDHRWIGENPIAHGPEGKRGLIC